VAALLLYQWNYIAPGATVSNFVHGFTRDQLGVCDAIPYNIGNIGTALYPALYYQVDAGRGKNPR
jgi:hypothetical protein